MGLIAAASKIIRPKWALVAAAIVAAWQAYVILKPKRPALDAPRQEAAEQACWQALDKLPSLPRDKVAVLRLAGDQTGLVTQKLRDVAERAGQFAQPAPGLLDRVLRELRIDEKPVDSLEGALAAGQKAEVPYVLYGRVWDFTSDLHTGRIRMELTLVSVADARPAIAAVRIAVPDPDAPTLGQTVWSGAWRFGVWLAAVVLLPIVTYPVIKRVLDRESNLAILLALVGYALAAWVLAFALSGFAIAGWLAGLVLLAGFVAALLYDYYTFCVIERRR